MAAKKMTVGDAYAKAKKSNVGGTLTKGSKRAQQVKRESKSQNPSARNKVGAKPKNKPGPWDDIARGVSKGAKIADAVVKSIAKPAYDPIGSAKDAAVGLAKDIKNKNLAGLGLQAASAIPVGRLGTAAATAAKGAMAAGAVAKAASAASKAATAGGVARTAGAAAKAAATTAKTVSKPRSSSAAARRAINAAKKTAGTRVTTATGDVKKATEELGNVRRAMAQFKGPKNNGRQLSSGWAALKKKEAQAQNRLRTEMAKAQEAGKAAENMKKVGVEKPKQRDTSMGSTTVGKKGDGGVPLPVNTKMYSKIPKNTKDTANVPLEKNQRYAYEADEMKRLEGKERFWKKEQRRMESKKKTSEANKARQTKVDATSKEARVKANWADIKKKAETGGPRAKERAERFKKFWAEQGMNLK